MRKWRVVLDLAFPFYAPETDVFSFSKSGNTLSRKIGKITKVDVEYIGYDKYLSSTLYRGAIETDLIFSSWESGMPVWTLSWELIWVASAVDREKGRSYIMR
jgi:S1-C subfamily serine protease